MKYTALDENLMTNIARGEIQMKWQRFKCLLYFTLTKVSSKSVRSPMLYLPRDPTPSAAFHRTAQVYGAFTDLLGLCGRIKRRIISAFSRFSKQTQ